MEAFFGYFFLHIFRLSLPAEEVLHGHNVLFLSLIRQTIKITQQPTLRLKSGNHCVNKSV